MVFYNLDYNSFSLYFQLTHADKVQLASRKLIQLKLKNGITKVAVNDFLNFHSFCSELFGYENAMPTTFQTLETKADFGQLNYKIGFDCPGCEFKCLISSDDKYCSNCGQKFEFRTIMASNHFFVYDLHQMISLILEKKELKEPVFNDESIMSFCDGEKYRVLVNSKPGEKVITIQTSSDGVALSDCSNIQIWTLFFKINELDVKEDDKVFLFGCYIGDKKPEVDYYLDQLVSELNEFYDDGLFVQKLNQTVYPLALNCILDLPAKAHYLNHIAHNGQCGCTVCEHPGESHGVGKRIFRPTNRRVYKTKRIYNRLRRGRLYKGTYCAPILKVK